MLKREQVYYFCVCVSYMCLLWFFLLPSLKIGTLLSCFLSVLYFQHFYKFLLFSLRVYELIMHIVVLFSLSLFFFSDFLLKVFFSFFVYLTSWNFIFICFSLTTCHSSNDEFVEFWIFFFILLVLLFFFMFSFRICKTLIMQC